MSEELLSPVLSAVIAGVFGLIAKRMELGGTQQIATEPSVQPAPGIFNFGVVLKHVGILQFLANLIGFFAGFAMAMTEASEGTIIVVALLLGSIFLCGGFFWAAISVERAIRWRHLSVVAAGVAVTTVIINAIVLPQSITAENLEMGLVVALVQSFVCMGIGGFIANSVKQ